MKPETAKNLIEAFLRVQAADEVAREYFSRDCWENRGYKLRILDAGQVIENDND